MGVNNTKFSSIAKINFITSDSLGTYLEENFDTHPRRVDCRGGECAQISHGDRGFLFNPSINDGKGYIFWNEDVNELTNMEKAGWPVKEAEKDVNDSRTGNVSYHPEAYSKWWIKNSGYDKNGDGKIDIKEAVTTENAKYKIDVSDIIKKYGPYQSKLDAFMAADQNNSGWIEKNLGEYALLLKYYAEHTPGGLTKDGIMSRAALDAFAGDTGMTFRNRDTDELLNELAYNDVNDPLFLIKLAGVPRTNWKIEDIFNAD